MQRKSSSGRRTFRLIITYMFMVVAVVGIVTVLVFMLLGYRIGKDGKISQGGLVQFGSVPSGATVGIDGSTFGSHTPSQATLGSGQHVFSYQKSGYRAWHKTLNLRPGSVLWLNYARLVPTELTPESITSFATVSSALASPNNNVMAIIANASVPKITFANLKSDSVKITDSTIAASSYTKPKKASTQSFRVVSWSNDSRYVLVKHTYDGGSVEWLRIDTHSDDKKAINLTTTLAVSLKDLRFRPSNSDQLYAISTGDSDLRLINLDDSTISAPLAVDVDSYNVADDGMVTYVTNLDPKTNSKLIGYVSNGSTKSQNLRTYSDAKHAELHVASGVYYGQRYVAVAFGSQLTVFKANLPDSGSSDASSSLQVAGTKVLSSPSVDAMAVHTRGRFIIVQHATTYNVYDIELGRYTTAHFPGERAALESDKAFAWLDNYTLYSDDGGTLQLAEFDGANHQTIGKVVPGLDAALSPNGKYLYSFVRSKDGKVEFSRVKMILD